MSGSSLNIRSRALSLNLTGCHNVQQFLCFVQLKLYIEILACSNGWVTLLAVAYGFGFKLELCTLPLCMHLAFILATMFFLEFLRSVCQASCTGLCQICSSHPVVHRVKTFTVCVNTCCVDQPSFSDVARRSDTLP